MSEFTWTVIVIGSYRIITVLAGVLAIYLGYKLFRVGIYEKAGDLRAAWGSNHLVLKQAAPGTFFSLFGVIVITFGIWKGIDIKSHETYTGSGNSVIAIPASQAEMKNTPSSQTPTAAPGVALAPQSAPSVANRVPLNNVE